MIKTYGAGISRPKPIGWKPNNKISEAEKKQIITIYMNSPQHNYAHISRITGISDNCIRRVVREHLGKQ